MFSRLYETVLRQRIVLYEKGFFKSFSLGAFTVSVGNLTVGGTGKTPLVAFISEILAKEGEKVAVLSRGYKRESPKKRVLVSDYNKILADAERAGDEPLELARKLLGKAIVVADADRVSAGNWAREKFGITAFVLDDAFQHLRALRNLDVVTVDATNPFGNGKLLPLGALREPLQNLYRADAIVITRANLVKTIETLKAEIKKYNSVCPIFVSENKVSKIIKLEDFHANTQKTRDKREKPPNDKFMAFCGLGNPQNFFEQLRQENLDLTYTETFPDHYFYKQSDIERIERAAQRNSANALLTTAKDAVKLKKLKFTLPCFVVESEIVFTPGTNFSCWLTSKLKNSRQKPVQK